MANLNKTQLIGRLTRDPETRMMASGLKIANVGFVVNNRKKNASSGQWEEEPVFVDCTAFGKTAELVEQYLRKGSQAYIEGHLKLDQWEDKNGGGKRSKLSVIIDNVQFLDSRQQQKGRSEPQQQSQYQPADDLPPGPGDENIPF